MLLALRFSERLGRTWQEQRGRTLHSRYKYMARTPRLHCVCGKWVVRADNVLTMYVLRAIAMLTHCSRTVFLLPRTLQGRASALNVRLFRSLLADRYKTTHRCSPEITVAVALKCESYNRSYCGICCFRCSMQWQEFVGSFLYTGEFSAHKVRCKYGARTCSVKLCAVFLIF